MQTDWYAIVDGQRVFAGLSPTGTILWEGRTDNKPIQIVLFPDPEMPEIPLPETACVIHLSCL